MNRTRVPKARPCSATPAGPWGGRRQAWIPVAGLLLASGAFAADARFSHRLHLKQVGAACVVCHESAAASNAAEDRNLPREETCLACHNGETAPTVDTKWLARHEPDRRTFRFDHALHVKFDKIADVLRVALDAGSYLGETDGLRRLLDTDNACQGCHRGLEETDLASKENLPVMSDCLVCHPEIDNPFSCEKCHLPGVNLKPADHTREFVDLHSTGRLDFDKATCLPCHGTNFACMGCH